VRQLNGQDASFLYLESPGAHLHLTALYIYDQSTVPGKTVRHKDILRYIESRLHTSPVFRQKLVQLPLSMDYPYWVDDEHFDLEFHVRHFALAQPRDWRQLCITVARIHSRPLDLTRPPWDMHIIEGLDNVEGIPKGAFAIVARYHHAAVDGVTGTEILSGLHSLTPDHDPDPEPLPWEPRQAPSLFDLMNRAAVNNVRTPFRLAKAVANTLPGVSRSVLRNSLSDAEPSKKVPDTRFNDEVSPHRVFEAVPFDLKELASTRKAVPGATVNDVVLAICGGALWKYLAAHDELPDESLIAAVPINTRDADEQGVSGNVIAMMLIPVHTDIEDPIERLRAVHEATYDAKVAERAVSARQMTDLAQHIPAATEALAGRLITSLGLGHRTSAVTNCVVTNVPGPQQPLYLNGARMLRSTGCGPVLDGMGLIITAISYDGEIVLSITGCRKITPDPEFLADCLRSSFDELKGASTAQAKKVTSTAAATKSS